MSPYQHGEVFVTDDGAETDLDLGHYERFTGNAASKRDNITTPNEGRNLSFASDTEEKTLALTFQPSAPTAFTQIRKVNDAAEITFYFSRSLRNTLPADNDLNSLLTVVNGNGSLSGLAMSVFSCW